MAGVFHGCLDCLALLVSPAAQSLWEEKAPLYGPGVAGALFGAGWWFFVDAIVYSSAVHGSKPPGILCLPGIIASLALVMINCIRRDQISGGYDSFDEGSLCRSKFWLFLSYVVSFSSVVFAVWLLIAHNGEGTEHAWSSIAGLFQVVFILGSGLVFFLTRTANEDSGGAYF
mmetsp:Transcript_34595/g.61705  ORF Transcript_34595/g.61705 Transcript_34595/m.61705 type:complete len:172 (-) Transcript_34595:553-1068(-)|eukprot:CAMPEP_0177774394 /NCGR_PEP_ID=MMETSP0491_2-20121128/13470_1 /TAXON_ID=63592 /ORGANISM="Tetraselmis chuii, Strain PLY429" /LENGTH=171 /DNA_ID=CAMNT_0019292743 /DNA_START=107 /DNA_END=622 /DNA_ORIENTATION=-